MPEVNKETKEFNINIKREKQIVDLRPLSCSIVAFAIVALFFLMFNIWKEANDRGLINCGSKNLVEEHSWEDSVKVNWLVHRTDFIKDIKGVKYVQLFVKANVSNKNQKQYLSVSSITLELLSKSGITLSSHSENPGWEKRTVNNSNTSNSTGYDPNKWKKIDIATYNPDEWEPYTRSSNAGHPICPLKSEEITFKYWVPVEIYKDITSLSANLGYSLSK